MHSCNLLNCLTLFLWLVYIPMEHLQDFRIVLWWNPVPYVLSCKNSTLGFVKWIDLSYLILSYLIQWFCFFSFFDYRFFIYSTMFFVARVGFGRKICILLFFYHYLLCNLFIFCTSTIVWSMTYWYSHFPSICCFLNEKKTLWSTAYMMTRKFVAYY